jgi:DNA (cytosine-5)-methyltransferase 1
MPTISTLELCAGAGGQALGLEGAGIEHVGLVEIDPNCCKTLKFNRPNWNVINADLREFDAAEFKGVDLVSGGLPCPPFSVAGKQLGESDDRNLFPAAIRIIEQVKPRAVMIENVRGILDAVFVDFRKFIAGELGRLGYHCDWKLLVASDYGVPQLRPRVVFVAIRKDEFGGFHWPPPSETKAATVGETLYDLMAEKGWRGAKLWKERANEVAPTIVGGSLKHGGPDLGPTRARKAWASLGVDGLGIVDEAPPKDFVGMPRLTVRMVARIQGFPDSWILSGKKTAAYRQVGNAFPPPVAKSVASAICRALSMCKRLRVNA